MVFGRVLTACAALALVTAATGARADDFVIGMGGRGEDESRSSADEPAIASARAGPQATANFHSSPGDGLANMAVRGVAQATPGSRTGALFRSMLVPGYGQVYNGDRAPLRCARVPPRGRLAPERVQPGATPPAQR